eukprot:scaffold3246_cov69-Cylindrotheca_fusiformis.AAC.3
MKRQNHWKGHDHFFRPRNPLPKDENQAISPNKPDTQTAGPRDDGDDVENRGGRIVSLDVTAMTSVVSTISFRVCWSPQESAGASIKCHLFPTTAVLLIPAGIHCVGLVLALVAVLFRRPRTPIRQVIEDSKFDVVVAWDMSSGVK